MHGLKEAINLEEIKDLPTDDLEASYKVAGERLKKMINAPANPDIVEHYHEAIIREEFLKAAVRHHKKERNDSEKQIAFLNMQVENLKKQIK